MIQIFGSVHNVCGVLRNLQKDNYKSYETCCDLYIMWI